MEQETKQKTKVLKRALIIGGSVLGAAILAFGGFVIYMNTAGVARGGETVKFSAKKIGKNAFNEEKSVTINKHTFTYFNVKTADDGGWVLVDHTSYIINTDIVFGFRYKNYDLVTITSYNDSKSPRFMGTTDVYPGYGSFEVRSGFKLAINESVDPGEGINIGILMHWC